MIRLSFALLVLAWSDFQVLTARTLPDPTTPAIQPPTAFAESSLPKMYPCLRTWAWPAMDAL